MPDTNYTVDEKDTVAGRVSTTDFNEPIYRRAASLATRAAASRGLTRSSISVGAGIGQALDKAVDIAKTDSTNIVNTGNQNAVNNTSIRNTDSSNTSNENIAKLDTDTQKELQVLTAKENRDNLASELESREGIASQDRAATNLNQAANRQVEQQRITSQESIASAALASEERKSEFDRQNNVLLTNLNNENKLRIEEMRLRYQGNADRTTAQNDAWGQYQAGLANIDPNASSSSQNTQFNRLSDAFDARMDFISGITTKEKQTIAANQAPVSSRVNESQYTGVGY